MFLIDLTHATNEVKSLDYNKMRIEVVNFFLVRFDVDILFDFTPSTQANGAFQIDPRHEHRYNGHIWCKVKTTNIKNSFGLGFKSTKCLGHLQSQNDYCFLFNRLSVHNKVNWNGDLSQVLIVG